MAKKQKPAKVAETQKNSSSAIKFLQKVSRIEKLPKNVRESIPINSFMPGGIIETTKGVFTKAYKLEDVNFTIAPLEEQAAIHKNFCDLLNSFDSTIKWQICIYNHEIDKRKTMEEIRIAPQKDGNNKYRMEMNNILISNLKKGNNSISQGKYLIVAIEDTDSERAAMRLRNLDVQINQKLRNITGSETKPMTSQERIELLYNIYNQDSDYRLTTGIYQDKELFNLAWIEKQGLSLKDLIGPSSFDFSKGGMSRIGDMYASTLYLERIPTRMSTDFLNDLSAIQSNMLISLTYEAESNENAVKLVRYQMASVEAQAASVGKRNAESGYFGALPADLERQQNNARDLMNDITSRNQNVFYITVTVTAFGRTQDQLDEIVKNIKSVAAKHICPVKVMKYQQEFAFNTSLPLCRNDIFVDRMFTTESASVFIPYNSREMKQKNAIFYGLNRTSNNMILYNRTTGDNYNGLIFGASGSGKSFMAKIEMISVLLNRPNAQVFVIDPQGEYYPLAKAFNGEEIFLAPGSNVHINPLDMDISSTDEDDVDPVTMKSDFVISMFDIIIGKNRQLLPIHTSLIDKCVRKIYRAYIDDLRRTGKTVDIAKCPTLNDLYQELMDLKSERYEAGQLADILYQYTGGSFDTFARRTNVETNARFVVYNTKKLGTGMKELGLHICLNDIWNRMMVNSKRHVYTWFYIDEFHLLLENEGSTVFLKRIWKMARKWAGVPTGIMQNTEDLLRNEDTRNIVNNTSFVIMMSSSLMDRQNLGTLFKLSPQQLEYITNSNKGNGLIYNGKVTLPFNYDFPKNTELYKLIDTSHSAGSQFS